MRTIAVAVAILSACFMQEVSGDSLSEIPDWNANNIPETKEEAVTHLNEESDGFVSAAEKKENDSFDKAIEELDLVAEKLSAKAEELNTEAAKVGASAEAKAAAELATK